MDAAGHGAGLIFGCIDEADFLLKKIDRQRQWASAASQKDIAGIVGVQAVSSACKGGEGGKRGPRRIVVVARHLA